MRRVRDREREESRETEEGREGKGRKKERGQSTVSDDLIGQLQYC